MSKNLGLQEKDIGEIKNLLLKIFRDIFYNRENVLKAKENSDYISNEIMEFIFSLIEGKKDISEIDFLSIAKEKGNELSKKHDLIFLEKSINKKIKVRVFLIPGLEMVQDSHSEIIKEDMQMIDHEICIGFKAGQKSEFIKIGYLIDLRAKLTKAIGSVSENSVNEIILNNSEFKKVFESSLAICEDLM